MKSHDFSKSSEFQLISTGYSEAFLQKLKRAALVNFGDHTDQAKDKWARSTHWVEDPYLTSMLCGEELKSHLEQRFRCKLAVHADGLPKISVSTAPWEGLPLHTDFDPAFRELTCCLWLTSMVPDQGGTLILYDAQKKESRRLTPERGTMLAFVPSPSTWHNVTPLIYGIRISILYSFLLIEEY